MKSNPSYNNIYPEIVATIQLAISKFNTITIERKLALQELSEYVQIKIDEHNKVELIFICTHNSRRSHFAQILAQAAAAYYGIKNAYCFSGGTEVTAFNENAVNALRNIGFQISANETTSNPVYTVTFGINTLVLQAFSKTYTSAKNPTTEYGAILTCTQADESCPIVHGAEVRFKIPYEDPKIADGKPEQESVYNERSMQIATEMCYVFSLLTK